MVGVSARRFGIAVKSMYDDFRLTVFSDEPPLRGLGARSLRNHNTAISDPAVRAETAPRTKPANYPQLFLLASSHFMLDAYSGFLSPILPLLIAKFGLSLTLAALLLSVYQLIASTGQALFGFLADRFPRFDFSVWSLVITGTFISAMGWAPRYFLVLVLLILAGLSTASYHPQAAAMSGEASKESRAFGMAVFMTAGRLGYAVGPLIAVPIAVTFGHKVLILAALPALILAAVLHRRRTPVGRGAPWPGRAEFLKPFVENFRPLALLWSFEAFRTGVMTGLSAFLPLMLIEKGYSLVAAGASVSLFIGGGAVGNLIGGRLADRIGRKRVLVFSGLGAIPFAYGFLWTEGALLWVCLTLLGAVLLSSLGVTLAKGQELVPASSGTVSSLIMGITWTLGSVGILFIGAVGDWAGLPTAIAILFLLLVPAGICAWLLPPDRESPAERAATG